jgi:hypothetical protein
MSYSSAYIFPQEGLDYLMDIVPKGATASGTIFLGLWGSWYGDDNPTYTTTWETISGYATAGNIDITLNGGTYPVYEVTGDVPGFTGYSDRTALTAGNWGAQTTTTVNVPGNAALPVRYSTYTPAIQFTNGGATVSGINGIFLCVGSEGDVVGSVSSADNTVLWYAPFSDFSSVTLASGDSISITPTWQSAAFQS